MRRISQEIRILYKPIKIVQWYLYFIIFLYLFGPLNWRTQNPFLLYMFLFGAQGLLYIGYSLKMKQIYAREANDQLSPDKKGQIIDDTAILKYLSIFIPITLVLTGMYLIRNTGLSSFSIQQIIDNIIIGFTNSGAQYKAKFVTQVAFGGGFLAPIITIMSPFTWPVIPLSLIYFKRLRISRKVMTVLMIVLEAARSISTGTNKGVIDLIITVAVIFIIKQWQDNYLGVIKAPLFNRSRKIITTAIIITLFVLGLSLFGHNISSRVSDNYKIISLITASTEVNMNSPLMTVTPPTLQPLLVYTTQYLTQGYYGLSLALNEPFIPMFGVGNSDFLIENIQDTFNVNIWQYTYQARIAYKGWDPFVNWHSIYVWLANDFSFFGVIILMFFFGQYFAIVTFKCLVIKDPIASSLFVLIMLCFFYFPCNNQIFSSPITFMAFWGLNIYWLLKSNIMRRRNCIRNYGQGEAN
jgi:hypothetical protein